MTYDQIVAAGIDPTDPANQNVYQFSVNLAVGPTPASVSGYTATGGTGAHPVTKIGKLMNSIDEVDADATQESSGRLIKDCEAVPFVALRTDIARGDKVAALLN